jgi:hypothetical protein
MEKESIQLCRNILKKLSGLDDIEKKKAEMSVDCLFFCLY